MQGKGEEIYNMEPEHKEKLRLLKKGIDQLNKKLFVKYIILSLATASILTILIDFFWDLRLIVFLIWFLFLTYVAYKLLFEIKFSMIRKRFDVTQKVNDDYYNEIKEGYISSKFGKYDVRLNLKDCKYTLTDDFVFAFQAFILLAIFNIDKSKPENALENFLSKFKKKRDLKLVSAFSILLIIMAFALKIGLMTSNQNFFKDDFMYKVQKINVGDSVLYDTSHSEFIILTTNFLIDDCPETDVVKFHCRYEYFKKIRLINLVLNNLYIMTEKKFTKKFLGYYSFYIRENEIILSKDDIIITIEKKLKINTAPN